MLTVGASGAISFVGGGPAVPTLNRGEGGGNNEKKVQRSSESDARFRFCKKIEEVG